MNASNIYSKPTVIMIRITKGATILIKMGTGLFKILLIISHTVADADPSHPTPREATSMHGHSPGGSQSARVETVSSKLGSSQDQPTGRARGATGHQHIKGVTE